MRKQILIGGCLLALFACGCSTSDQAVNANVNANANNVAAVPTSVTRPGPDNSEITTTTDANGVKSETRVFRDNPRVAKVVVTTRGGNRIVHVYSRSGEEREVTKDQPANALEATGDAIADAAGFVADKTVAGAKKGVEISKTVGEKTVAGAKTVGEKTGDVAKTVGEKTGDAAKTVGQKTAAGAKKTGKAIRNAVAP